MKTKILADFQICISVPLKGKNKLLSVESVFSSKKYLYSNALKDRGYIQNIEFQQNVFAEREKRKSKRRCKIIWFNPPYSHNVATDMVEKFLFFCWTNFFQKFTSSTRSSTETVSKSPNGKYFQHNKNPHPKDLQYRRIKIIQIFL